MGYHQIGQYHTQNRFDFQGQNVFDKATKDKTDIVNLVNIW